MPYHRAALVAIFAFDLLWTHALYPLTLASFGWHVAKGGPLTFIISLFLASVILHSFSVAYTYLTDPKLFHGPSLAKGTILWKAFHIATGTYQHQLRELHRKYGCIVQVAPDQFSLNDAFHISRARLVKILSPFAFIRNTVRENTLTAIHERISMANIFNYEAGIQKCNDALLETLMGYTEGGESFNLTELLARYAYDTVFVTTTGEPAGFLERNMNVSNIKGAMERWKSTSILCGTYFRFRPFITRLICRFQPRNLESMVSKHLRDAQPDKAHSTVEACVALMLAGADPMVTHLLSSILCIYRYPAILKRIRAEILAAKLSHPPTIKELLYAAPRMPNFHAALQESLHLLFPCLGTTYTTSDRGCKIQFKQLPEGRRAHHLDDEVKLWICI